MAGESEGKYIEKTKKHLMKEINTLQARVVELEHALSESQWAEDVLKQGELVAAATIEGMPDGVMLVNMSGEIIYVNKAFEKLLGYKANELIGTSALKLPTYSESKDRVKAHGYLKKAIKKSSTKPIDMNAITKDGEEIPINFTASVIKDAQGNPKTLVAVIRDISERKHAEDELARYTKQLETLFDIGTTVSQILNFEELLVNVLDKVLEVTGVEVTGIFLLDEKTKKLVLRAHRGMSSSFVREVRVLSGKGGVLKQVLETGKPLIVENVSADCRFNNRGVKKERVQSFAALSIMTKEKILGVMVIGSYRHREFLDWEVRMLSTIANQIGMAIENAQLYERALELAFTDGLTSLYNRRYLMEQIEREFSRAERNKEPLSLIMVDLDGLKEINDRFGHNEGDQFLREVGRIIKVNTRASDVAARWGGDEFMLLTPETDSSRSAKIAERIRTQVERYRLDVNGREVGITVSAGVVSYPAHASGISELIKNADEAMYNAKKCGKNQSCIFALER